MLKLDSARTDMEVQVQGPVEKKAQRSLINIWSRRESWLFGTQMKNLGTSVDLPYFGPKYIPSLTLYLVFICASIPLGFSMPFSTTADHTPHT